MSVPDLPREYQFRYEGEYAFGNWNHAYLIIARHGAVHFHVTEFGERMKDIEPSGGLELHYRVPPGYMADQAPSHSPCRILGAPCWHDGTSLYATETLIPRWRTRSSEAEVFTWLVSEVGRLAEKAEGLGDD